MSVLAGVVTRAVAAAAAAGGAEGDMGKARREAGFCGGVLASWRAVARDFGAALVVSELVVGAFGGFGCIECLTTLVLWTAHIFSSILRLCAMPG
jgi:hypothetical protein